MSLWVYDIESDGLLDEVTYIHVVTLHNIQTDEWKLFVDLDRYEKENCKSLLDTDIEFELNDLSKLSEFLLSDQVKGLICHNQIRYDLRVFEKLGYIEEFEVSPDRLNDSPTRIFDTLVMSQHMHPDRPLPEGCPTKVYNVVTGKYDMIGPHGLAAWAYRTVGKKPQVDDWRNQPLFIYMDRCIEDVKINRGTWDYLLKEMADNSMGISWTKPVQRDHQIAYRLMRQGENGVAFHSERAEALVVKCDELMREIEAKVEPELPEMELPESEQPNFPAKPWKEDQEFSKTGLKWLERLGYEVDWGLLDVEPPPSVPFRKDGSLSVNGKKYLAKMRYDGDDPAGFFKSMREQAERPPIDPDKVEQAHADLRAEKMPPRLTKPMRLSNQHAIKLWLVEEGGWHPTMFGTKDITKDANKRQRSKEEIKELAEKYILETVKDSPYREYMAEILGVKKNSTKGTYTEAAIKKARMLPTSPKLKDDRGELCPDLERLQGEMVKDIVKWLSLRSRRTTLLPLDEKKTTGWLNNERIKKEGRISAVYHGITNTNRLKHINVRNVPKASEEVLLGWEFRHLFYAPQGKVFCTVDTSNMEALIGAWLAYAYDDGELYRLITSGGDTHQMNADAYSVAAGRKVGRGEGKGITYGVMYGAQAAKVSVMLGISKDKAQKVIDAYWDTNYGLKAVKEYLEKFWERTGQKYIKGIDGRRIYTRSKHSLLNAYIQSTGALLMNLAYIKTYDKLRDENILDKSPLVIYYHDEISSEVDKSLVTTYKFDTEEEAKAFTVEGKVLSEPKQFGEKYFRFYTRTGEIIKEAIEESSLELGSPFKLTGEYALGPSWAYTH